MRPSPHVLLIDDEEAIVRVVAEVLRASGYDRVTIATSGAEGLRTARTLIPDVIVCDVRMPGIGGEEVVLMLRAQPATAEIRIVLMSGYCEPDFAHIADVFLPKPFPMNELGNVIMELTDSNRARRLT